MAPPARKSIEWKIGQVAFEVFRSDWRRQHGGMSPPHCRVGEDIHDRISSDEVSRYARGKRIPTDPKTIAALGAVSRTSRTLLEVLLPAVSVRTDPARLGEVYAQALGKLGAQPRELMRVRLNAMPFYPHGYSQMDTPDPVARVAANTLELRRHEIALPYFRTWQAWYLAASIVDAAVNIPEFASIAVDYWDAVMEAHGPTVEESVGFGGEMGDLHGNPDELQTVNEDVRVARYWALRGSVAEVLQHRRLPVCDLLPVRFELKDCLYRLAREAA